MTGRSSCKSCYSIFGRSAIFHVDFPLLKGYNAKWTRSHLLSVEFVSHSATEKKDNRYESRGSALELYVAGAEKCMYGKKESIGNNHNAQP